MITDMPKRARLPDDKIAEMRKLRQEGLSFPKIGKQVGVSGKTVFKYTSDIVIETPPKEPEKLKEPVPALSTPKEDKPPLPAQEPPERRVARSRDAFTVVYQPLELKSGLLREKRRTLVEEEGYYDDFRSVYAEAYSTYLILQAAGWVPDMTFEQYLAEAATLLPQYAGWRIAVLPEPFLKLTQTLISLPTEQLVTALAKIEEAVKIVGGNNGSRDTSNLEASNIPGGTSESPGVSPPEQKPGGDGKGEDSKAQNREGESKS